MSTSSTDVLIIGAGPAGSVAGAMLANAGYKVEIVERAHFPRFSIGESLLPQSMEFLERAGLAEAVKAHGFQYKDGAAFYMNGVYTDIFFPDKSASGPSTIYQVMRSEFDDILARGAVEKGCAVTFGQEVIAFESNAERALATIRDEAGATRQIEARYALDASGFGRTLSKLCKLETPSNFPIRRAVFGQFRDNITEPSFDRNKILVSIHPTNSEIWFWLIPLANGISSVGVVGPDADLLGAGATEHDRLWSLIRDVPYKAKVLANAEVYRPAATIGGYACNVTSLIGPRYALLGNAAEFLDPVFSSGVTIAMKSATLAADLIDREFRGEQVDWQREYVEELYVGIDSFRTFVTAWYTGALQRIIFNRPRAMTDITRMLTSVLAGYAWDRSNRFVSEPQRFMRIVEELCAG
ncbi:MAG TPA: NAD(P)/FAD-dependent oxidoreductase [Caulobacterales bacterium]|nr:NAD(P)/FAD-dependent oxidoreductase [Caulobacterales bacterium]